MHPSSNAIPINQNVTIEIKLMSLPSLLRTKIAIKNNIYTICFKIKNDNWNRYFFKGKDLSLIPRKKTRENKF